MTAPVPEGRPAHRHPAGSVGVLVGNPKPASRTLSVATAVADAVSRALGREEPPEAVIDLAGLGPRLFDSSDATVGAAAKRIAECRVLVVASPTYKGTYTGLLKSFLDRFPSSALSGVCAVPVMVGAGPRHALAVDVHLRPVLIDMGASMPTRGLFVLESELHQLDRVIGEWIVEAGGILRANVTPAPP